MTFPTTLAEWTTLLSNPLTAAFAIYMLFRVLNRQPGIRIPLSARFTNDKQPLYLTIAPWSDGSKVGFAFVLTLLWSVGVSALAKDFTSGTPDVWPLIIARAVGFWTTNQLTYAALVKLLGPIGAKILGGQGNVGEIVTSALEVPAAAKAAA